MKNIIKISFLIVTAQVYGQQISNEVQFDTIVSHFQKKTYSKDIIHMPVIHKNNSYTIEISNSPLQIECEEVVIKNPCDKKYPISYSVIYQDRLITLFEQGNFICQSILTFDRDTEYEKYLNTRKFQYHWLLDNKLIGLSDKKYYFLNSENIWVEFKNTVPFSNQPKLFEDNTYISFCDCHGEWGGTVYFFNKQTNKTHYTEATCANSIIKKDKKYYILSQLGHMMGSTDLLEISNPDELPTVELKNINKTFQGKALGYTDTSKIAKSLFRYFEVQIFSSIIYNDIIYYLVNWRDETFLAEIKGSIIKIVNPLFNKEFYTHRPITTNYENNTTLINFDLYSVAGNREVYCIVLKNGKLTKIDWNEKHFH